MPRSAVVAAFERRVGDLVFEYENEYLSAFDRTVRVCPWLARFEPDQFFKMRPFQKDARTVVALEEGFGDWSALLEAHSVEEVPIWSELDDNELTALGLKSEFDFGGPKGDYGMLDKCIRWLCLSRNFGAVRDLCRAVGKRVILTSPSLLTHLVEAGAPCDAIDAAMSMGAPRDLQKAVKAAFHWARADVLKLLEKAGPLPVFQPVDYLLKFCYENDAPKVNELVRADPLLWHRNANLAWWTASSWSESGGGHALEAARRCGLFHPKEPANWRTPLHGAAWMGDRRALVAGLDMDCPINLLDQRNSSSPMGWLVRSVIMLPSDSNPFNTPEKADCARLLSARGALVMPGYLNSSSRNLLAEVTGV